MIAMVSHSQSTLDQIGNSLRGPQLGPVSVCHGPLGQETNESLFLLRGQSGRPAGCRLGFQCLLPTGLQGIAPTHNAARMATYTSGNLMQGEFLFQERNHTTSTLLQQFWRSLRSHGDTPFRDASIILHYLCGSK
jgi:hypothetical protein